MLAELIQNGESKTIEFKESMPRNSQIAKTVCAFANRAGGKILIGINDAGTILGLEDEVAQMYLENLPNIINDSITPMLLPEIYAINEHGRVVVVIEVFPGQSGPYYLKSVGKQGGTYLRVGRTNKQADGEMLQNLERNRMNMSYDIDLYGEVDDEVISELRSIVSTNIGESVTLLGLRTLGLLQCVGSIEYLTNGGAVVLGVLEQSVVRCARFAGDTPTTFIDKKEYDGNIFEQIERATGFIVGHLNVSGSFVEGQLKRQDELEIDYNIVREAVINAVLHREYGISGSDIKIAVYNNRVDIISPGGLKGTITVDEIYAGRSEIRNRVLAKVFLRAKLIEQWGSGIPRIREASRIKGYRLPELSEDGLFVKLTIPRALSKRGMAERDQVREVGTYTTSNVRGEKKETDQLIIEGIHDNNHITVKQLGVLVGKTPSTVQRCLSKLQVEGKIVRVGSKKTGYWVLQ